MANKLKEAADRISDLENAMRVIGTISVDPSVPWQRKADRIYGVLAMYGCEPRDGREERAGA